MVQSIIQMVGIIALILALVIWVGYHIVKRIKPTAISLNSDGWILIHPHKKPVAFSNAPDANHYAHRTRRAGIFWDVYAIHQGKIVHCGNTQNSIIA